MNRGKISSWYKQSLPVLSLLLWSSCVPVTNYKVPETVGPVKEKKIEEEKAKATPEVSTQQIIKAKQTPEQEDTSPKEKKIEEERAKAAPEVSIQKTIKAKQTPEGENSSILEDRD